MLRPMMQPPPAPNWLVVVAVAVLSTTVACQPGPRESAHDTETSPAGCWELELAAEGTQADSVRNWLPRGTLPPVIELDTARASGQASSESAKAAYSWFNGRREEDPFSLWRPMRGDSLLVQRAGARAGLMLRLVHSEDRLEGLVVSFTDVRSQNDDDRPQAPVEATRTECPEPQSMNPMGDKPG